MKRPSNGFVIVLSILAAPIVLLDLFSPTLGIASCPSENLSSVANTVREYAEQHGGTLPEQLEEFRQFMVRAGEHDYLFCNRTRRPLVWRPNEVKTSGDGVVIVMCPPRSHGLIRKYAWAVVAEGSGLKFAIVRGDDATVRGSAL